MPNKNNKNNQKTRNNNNNNMMMMMMMNIDEPLELIESDLLTITINK